MSDRKPPSPALVRTLLALEWGFASAFLFARPLVTGPSSELSARLANLLLTLFGTCPALLWVLRSTLTGRLELRSRRILLPATCFLSALALSSLAADDRSDAVSKLADWFVPLAWFAWMAQQAPRDAKRMLWVLAASGAASVSVGIFQAAGGLELIQAETHQECLDRRREAWPRREPDWQIALFNSRVDSPEIFGTFFPFYSNAFAGFLAMLLPLYAGLLADAIRSRAPPLLATLLATLLAAGIWCLAATGSLGGWIAAVFGMGLFVAHTLHVRFRTIAAFLILAAAVSAVAGISGWVHPSIAVRLGYWHSAIGMLWDHFWLGVGPGNFHLFYNQYRPAWAGDVRHPHNELLSLWAEGGIFLTGAFAWLWWRILSFQDAPDENRETEAPGWRFAWGAFLVAAALPACWWAKTYMHSGDLIAETLFLTETAIFCLALWSVGPGRGVLDWGPFARAGVTCGLAALLLHSLGDFDFNVQGILQTVFPLAAILCAARGDSRREEPFAVDLPQAAQATLVLGVFAFGFLFLYELPDRQMRAMFALQEIEQRSPATGPDEYRELAARHYARALAATPWDTGILVKKAELAEALWTQDRREEDRQAAIGAWRAVARRRPGSGLADLRLALLVWRDGTPGSLLESVGFLEKSMGRIPTLPRPHYELGVRYEQIRRTPEVLTTWAKGKELPAEAASEDLKHKVRRQFEEAVRLNALIPDPQHKLPEEIVQQAKRWMEAKEETE